MEKYKVMTHTKAYLVNNLDGAKKLAERLSIVHWRVTIFKENKKVARYEWGEELPL